MAYLLTYLTLPSDLSLVIILVCSHDMLTCRQIICCHVLLYAALNVTFSVIFAQELCYYCATEFAFDTCNVIINFACTYCFLRLRWRMALLESVRWNHVTTRWCNNVRQTVSQSVCLSVSQSVSQSVCPSVSQSVCLSLS